MFGFDLIRTACARVAASLTGLAATIDGLSDGLRQQMALPAPMPALATPAVIIDHEPPAALPADDVAGNGRGRRKTTAGV